MPGAPIDALRRVPLFADLHEGELAQVALLFKERHFKEGETVVMEGSDGAAFFLIESGEASVAVRGSERASLGPGDHFGERGLLDRAPRNATVTTTEPSTLLRLEGDVLLDALQAVPSMRSTLDRSNVRRRSSAPHTALVDDPAYA